MYTVGNDYPSMGSRIFLLEERICRLAWLMMHPFLVSFCLVVVLKLSQSIPTRTFTVSTSLHN